METKNLIKKACIYILKEISKQFTLLFITVKRWFLQISWSKLFNDKTDPLTYLTNETTVVSRIDDNMNINNFDFSENTKSDIKIGTFPKGSRYYLKQKILFNFEKNGDLSINCKEYLNHLKQLNSDKSSYFGGIFEIGCDKNSFFRNTAQYGENRAIYLKK